MNDGAGLHAVPVLLVESLQKPHGAGGDDFWLHDHSPKALLPSLLKDGRDSTSCLSCRQVGDGFVEFQPSPAENRQLVRTQYTVPATLLVAFRDDAIDESAEMAALLRQVQPMGALTGAVSSYATSLCVWRVQAWLWERMVIGARYHVSTSELSERPDAGLMPIGLCHVQRAGLLSV